MHARHFSLRIGLQPESLRGSHSLTELRIDVRMILHFRIGAGEREPDLRSHRLRNATGESMLELNWFENHRRFVQSQELAPLHGCLCRCAVERLRISEPIFLHNSGRWRVTRPTSVLDHSLWPRSVGVAGCGTLCGILNSTAKCMRIWLAFAFILHPQIHAWTWTLDRRKTEQISRIPYEMLVTHLLTPPCMFNIGA